MKREMNKRAAISTSLGVLARIYCAKTYIQHTMGRKLAFASLLLSL
jgi:hypothetical protein